MSSPDDLLLHPYVGSQTGDGCQATSDDWEGMCNWPRSDHRD